MRVVFLDRDGVINRDTGYTHKIEEFEFLPRVKEALRAFLAKGYKLIIATNQSGIGRGYYNHKDFEKLTEWMLDTLACEGIEILEVYYCPHAPNEACECRKPHPLFIEEAVKTFGVDVAHSWMMGDKESDVEFGHNGGVFNTVRLCKNCQSEAKFISNSLFDTIELLD